MGGTVGDRPEVINRLIGQDRAGRCLLEKEVDAGRDSFLVWTPHRKEVIRRMYDNRTREVAAG
ncbi:hypothetical protein GCM10010220_35660 [Streptomyces parvulus]|nr:hypothetical protein GCM10010220_35660 [Streptomyces parvulus]